MSSIWDGPFTTQLPSVEPVPGSLQRSRAIRYLRFDHIATAAEVIGDLAAAAISLLGTYAAYSYLGLGRGVVYPDSILICTSVGFAALFVVLLDREGVYRKGSGMLRIRETEKTLRASVLAFLFLFSTSTLSVYPLSRLVLGIAFFVVPLAVVIEKQAIFSLVRFLHARGQGVQRVIIYGVGFTGKRVFSALLRSRKLGLNPVALVDDDEKMAGRTLRTLGYHHTHSESVIRGPVTKELILSNRADMVIVAVPTIGQDKIAALATLAKELGIMLSFVPSQPSNETAWVNYIDIDGLLLGAVGGPEERHGYQAVKRALDLALSVIALIALSPVLTLLALGVYLDSGGPVLFKQQRVGMNGKLFDIYKFRTMKVNAPRYDFSPTKSEDPRITRFGRILRKTSLDELPQILNVLKGEMSLVGPRPEMPFIVATYGPRERQRLSVLPGITGLWQLSADRSYLIHENPHYDLYYIRNRGFFMDIAILLHTAVFALRGI